MALSVAGCSSGPRLASATLAGSGPLNLPATMPEHASQLYARNVQALLELFMSDEGALAPDFDDEVVKGACVTHGGAVVNDAVKSVLGVGR